MESVSSIVVCSIEDVFYVHLCIPTFNEHCNEQVNKGAIKLRSNFIDH